MPTFSAATVAGPHGPVPIRRYPSASESALESAATLRAAPAPAPTFVWVHGGAFMSGGLDQAETHEVAVALAAAGIPVVTVDYRLLSRGHRFPVALDDLCAAVGEISADAPAGLVLGGASAGACLAAGAALRWHREGAPALRGVVFAYGLFHAVIPSPPADLRRWLIGLRRIKHHPLLARGLARVYAGAVPDPLAFPGGHPVDGMPPALMLDAEHDVLRASGARFADELRAAEVPLDYAVVPGTRHAFLHRPHDPGFAVGIARILGWIRALPVA